MKEIPKLQILDLGLAGYETALGRQKSLVHSVAGGDPSVLILCEHPLTITLGRASHEENLLQSRPDLEAQGVQVTAADRGGDVTLHAPGQLVAYPIINLKRSGMDLKAYLRKLEQVGVDFLKCFGIVATGSEQRRGVWVEKDKIASIGIGVSRWVTYHGIAVNINTDLSSFKLIRPCGLDVRMTSLERVLGRNIDMAEAKAAFIGTFFKIFGFQPV